ncbi:MAG: GSCFA domain-containing protein [Chitinophagaceae bacterium]|nr:GSCFA domain-containing protein [Chitinophagaceae bacterium]
MKFHFEFDIKKLATPIQHRHRLMLMGSCFTENIGEKLRKHKFNTLENPNGILFNPVSVAEALTTYIDNQSITEKNLFQYNEAWHSWKHHSRFSCLSAEESVQKINQSILEAHEYLKTADYLMITLGSAWVYMLTEKASNAKLHSIAANNHKAPGDWFSKKLLSVDEILTVLDNVLYRLFLLNPKLQIIFTISPVRHLREGVIENNRSKAVLIQAVHHLVNKFNKLYYFPAYELVIDDLRDYRFYAEDLVHPNYQATQYVWEKLIGACMSEDTQMLMKEIADINLAYQHKPFNPDSNMHKAFLKSYFNKTKLLIEKYPFLDLEEELEFFGKGIEK